MGRMIYELEMALEANEEEGDIILNEVFMMVIFQGITDELPPFEKYWTHMFQNKSMPIFGDCQSNILTFARLRIKLFSPEDDTNKETSPMIEEMEVTVATALLADIRYTNPQWSIYQVLGVDSDGIIHIMLTMWLVYSRWRSITL